MSVAVVLSVYRVKAVFTALDLIVIFRLHMW
jgi:hypothetical protein